MPALPLPFLVSLLLAVLLMRLVRQKNWPAALFLGLCTLTSIVAALRWTFHLEFARLLQPLFAVLIPPSAWLCFSRLKEERGQLWPWLTAAAALYCISAIWIPWNAVDIIIGSLYLGIGAALIAQAWRHAESLGSVRLSDVFKANVALVASGGALLASAVCDSIIAADFDIYDGIHASQLVTGWMVAILPILACAAAIVGQITVVESRKEIAQSAENDCRLAPDAADQEVFAIFGALMRDKKLFKDPDLTLNRLARRAGVPARRMSMAVNRVVGRNISQVVNEYRIAEAQKLLLEGAQPVTAVMEAVGFRTKSNFNREFLRVTGTSPSMFRHSSELDNSGHAPVSAT